MSNDNSLLSIFTILSKWKKIILLAVGLVGLMTSIIVFLKPNYYKAETTFYAAHPDLAVTSGIGYFEKAKFIYGTSEDADRLFSIANSELTIQHLIKKFDLYKHYFIDSSSNKGKYEMKVSFKDNYSVTRSKYDAIVISVEDKDPIKAAEIANEAREFIDFTAQSIYKKAQGITLETNSTSLIEQEKIAQKLVDSIRLLKIKYNLIEPDYQAKALSEELVKAQGNMAESKAKAEFYDKYETKKDSFIKYTANQKGYISKVSELESKLSSFNKGVSMLKKLDQEFGRASDQISLMKENNKFVSNSFNSKFKTLHLVDKAYAPDYKSRPKRIIIILASLIISALAAVSGVLLIDSLKKRTSFQ